MTAVVDPQSPHTHLSGAPCPSLVAVITVDGATFVAADRMDEPLQVPTPAAAIPAIRVIADVFGGPLVVLTNAPSLLTMLDHCDIEAYRCTWRFADVSAPDCVRNLMDMHASRMHSRAALYRSEGGFVVRAAGRHPRVHSSLPEAMSAVESIFGSQDRGYLRVNDDLRGEVSNFMLGTDHVVVSHAPIEPSPTVVPSGGRMVVCASDASLRPSGAGGIGWVIVSDDRVLYRGVHVDKRTAAPAGIDRLETLAALKALREAMDAHGADSFIELRSDSTFAVHTIAAWLNYGGSDDAIDFAAMRTFGDGPSLHTFRAQARERFSSGALRVEWTRSHYVDPFNEAADRMAHVSSSLERGRAGVRDAYMRRHQNKLLAALRDAEARVSVLRLRQHSQTNHFYDQEQEAFVSCPQSPSVSLALKKYRNRDRKAQLRRQR